MKLHDHQRKAVNELKSGNILAGDVGSGKTFASLAWYVEKACGGLLDRSVPMRTPKKLVVITTAMKRNKMDWQTEAVHLGLFTDPELSYGHQEFIVDSYNMIEKYEDLQDCVFIFDEQRFVGNGAWVKSFLKIAKRNEWIMLSATPADVWVDYLPVFMANNFFKTRSEFFNNHVVWELIAGRYRKIKKYYDEAPLRRYRDLILVDMPMKRHTTRHLIAEPVYFDEVEFNRIWKELWNIYDDIPLVDAAEKHRLARRLVNSDPSRIEKIKKLSAQHPKLIIFYNFDYELEVLRTLHTELDIPVTEYNGHVHQDVLDEDRWIHLVQYTAGAEAWNCITTNAMVYYSLNYSHKIFEQTQGRIDRMNTPFSDLYYYILMSTAKIDVLIWRSLLAKKNFHEGRNLSYDADRRQAKAEVIQLYGVKGGGLRDAA